MVLVLSRGQVEEFAERGFLVLRGVLPREVVAAAAGTIDRLPGPAPGPAPGPRYKWIALSNTTLGVLMATVNSSIMLIALPASSARSAGATSSWCRSRSGCSAPSGRT